METHLDPPFLRGHQPQNLGFWTVSHGHLQEPCELLLISAIFFELRSSQPRLQGRVTKKDQLAYTNHVVVIFILVTN